MTNKIIDFESSLKPEEVLAEVKARLSKNNPNIGAVHSTFLKEGPKAYKMAIIYQVLNAETQNHHHFVLLLQTYSKEKKGWSKKKESSISLSNEEKDEIGILIKFITEFRSKVPTTDSNYGIVKQEDYQRFAKYLRMSDSDYVEDILEDKEQLDLLLQKGDINLISYIFQWITSTTEPKQLIEKLKTLDIDDVKKINSLTGIAQIKNIVSEWQSNKDNDNEEYWQNMLTRYSWCLNQIYSSPVVLLQNKAYLGGKTISNLGGNIVDFLYTCSLSENTLLIEIKTPNTRLLGSSYRQTYSVSKELSGSVNQTLKYKDFLLKNYNNLARDSEKPFNAFNPKTIVIIGNSNQLENKQQKEAFEIFRNNLRRL